MMITRDLPRLQSAGMRLRRVLAATAVLGLTVGALPASAETLVVAIDMDVNSLDPHRALCETCIIYNQAVYEGLLTLDASNKLAPVIAESWDVSDDLTTYTFTLNSNATFADGTKVEAKDVKWSWDRLKNMKAGPSGFTDVIDTIETPDEATVVVKTTAPNSEFLNLLTSTFFGVVNSDVAQSEAGSVAGPEAAETDASESWYFSQSAGAGPFVLESYQPGSELRLKRNENYWREPAEFDDVVMRQVGDAVAQAQLLQSGEADIALQVDAETAKSLSGSDIKVETVPSFRFILAAISPGAVANPFPLTPEIREAISIAIDRESLIEFTVGEGNGELLSVPFPLGFPGADGHDIPEYDPERSRQLLADAGKADGFALDATFPQLNVYGIDLSIVMQKIQQDLAKVKIDIDLKPIEMSAWRERVSGDHIPFTVGYWGPDFYGTSQFVTYFGLTEGALWSRRIGEDRDTSFLVPENATLMAEALKAKPEDAEKIWFEIGENIKNQNVVLPLISPKAILAYRNSLQGVRKSPVCNLPLYELSMAD